MLHFLCTILTSVPLLHACLIFPYFPNFLWIGRLFIYFQLLQKHFEIFFLHLKTLFAGCRRKITLQIFCHYALTSQVLLWFKNRLWTSACENVLFVGCWVLCLVEWKITRHRNTVRNITARYFELPWRCPFVLPQSKAMLVLYCLGCLQYCVLKISVSTGPVVTQCEHTFEAM